MRGIFLIMGTAGYISSTVVQSPAPALRQLDETSRVQDRCRLPATGVLLLHKGYLKRDLQGFLKGICKGSIKGLGFRVLLLAVWEFPKIGGILFWGPYKDPTI